MASTPATRASLRRANYKLEPIPADDPRHGTYNCYVNLSCRCDACRLANAVQQRSNRSSK